MASANNDVTDLITCPVCKDIYTDPKSLKCRHTLCAQCLDGLIGSRRSVYSPLIKCPCCREICSERDVRVDFKVQEMVAMFGAHVSLPENHLCEFCERNKLRWRCTQCEAMICNDCHTVHQKVTSRGKSGKHEVQSVQELAEKMRSKLMEGREKIDMVVATAEQDRKELQQYKAHLQKRRGELLIEIDRQEKTQLDAVVTSFNKLRQQLNSSVSEELLKLSYRMNQVQSVVTSAQQKFSILGSNDDDAPQSLTDIVVNYGNTDGEVSLMSLSDQWHAPAANLHINYRAPASTTTTPPSGGLVVESPSTTAVGELDIKRNYEAINFDKSLQISDLLSRQFAKKCEIKLPSYGHSLTEVGDTMWCTEFDKNRILVLNTTTGSVLKTITSAMLNHPTCVINTVSQSGRVLVGCSDGSGLHELDVDGNHKKLLFNGSFCSGAAYDDQVYLLQHHSSDRVNTSHVLVLRHNGIDWQKQRSVELDYCRNSHNDTLAISAQGMHVTSWNMSNLFLYDFNGIFQRYEAELPVHGPTVRQRLCVTDTQGGHLLTESCHGKVYFLSTDQRWCSLAIEQIDGPRDVIVANDRASIWLLEANGTKLGKYSEKRNERTQQH